MLSIRLGSIPWCPVALSVALSWGCADPPPPGAEESTSEESDSASMDEVGDEIGDEVGDGDGDSGDGDGDTSTSGDGDSGDGDGDGDLPPACGFTPPQPGTLTGQTVDVDGVTREYELFIPTTYDTDVPAPLVLNFHGLLGNPGQQADFSEFNETAEARGIVVAYPAGIGSSFNAGACCGEAQSQGVDDVGFARALVEKLHDQLCIDPQRTYAIGMSNGGHMAHLLGCEAADIFAAVASVTGVLGIAPASCVPARPISVFDFHGTGDLIVSYDGAGPGYPPVEDMMEGWAARNGCSPVSEVTFDQDDSTCVTWPGCDEGVEVSLCTIDGGGHCWPGNPDCLFGTSTTTISANELIADMFEQHMLP